jgi:hypothetical protein
MWTIILAKFAIPLALGTPAIETTGLGADLRRRR